VSAGLDALLAEGVAAGVFPVARAVVLLDGALVFDGGAAAPVDAVFDLASLTKVMATTAVFASLWVEGKAAPDTAMARWWPRSETGRSGVTLEDLLTHRSGLPAFEPYFAAVMREWPELLAGGGPAARRATAREVVVERALSTLLEAPPRTRALYSDVGFLLLGEALAAAGGAPLDTLFLGRVAEPIGLSARFRRLATSPGALDVAATILPTGATRPREPAPGQEGLWMLPAPHGSPPGEVDDDNAWVMDGVAGHAGLFGTAGDVARFGQAVLDDLRGSERLAPRAHWERALARDTRTPGSTRAFGFDTVEPGDPRDRTSAGHFVGSRAPGAVGHLGFTGTSLWIDRGRSLVIALCTNRTALGRHEVRIRDFRPRFHDAVVQSLGLAT
jgi:CubicO group peptidase (beta-lactamase class C family)